MTLSRVGTLVIAVALALGATGCNPTFRLQHFRVYEVDKVPVEERVRLTDQLDPAAKDARLVALSHFANPTRKVHAGHTAGVDRPDEHFNWYVIEQPQPEPRRTVRFRNQFGQHSVDIREPRFLLVPAQKTSHPGSSFPEDLDHYKCYQIITVNTVPPLPVVTLGDQFGSQAGVQVKDPRLFCIPAMKEREGEPPKPIFNKDDHLAVYELPLMPHQQQITSRDQFDQRPLEVRQSVMLAVPTEKQVVVAHQN
jgi:hypothetical protein